MAWKASPAYHQVHQCRQRLQTTWERFRGTTIPSSAVNAQTQVDVFTTHVEAEAGLLNAAPQWILPTNYGKLGARRQTQVTGAEEVDGEEDDWEEGFWEEGFWEEGIWGEYDSDLSDGESDATIVLEGGW